MTPDSGSSSAPRRRIRNRLLLPAAIVALAVVGLAAYRNVQLRHSQEELQLANALQLARVSAGSMDETIAEVHTLLVTVAQLLDPTLPPDRNDAILQRIFRNAPLRYSNIWMADSTGQLLGSARRPLRDTTKSYLGDRSYFRRAVATRRFTVGEVVTSRTVPGNPLVLTFAVPIIPDSAGPIRAVIGASIEVDSLEAVRSARGLPVGSVLNIMDNSGTVVYRTTDSERWIGKQFPAERDKRRYLSQLEGTGVGQSADGVFRLTGFRRMARAPWIVYVGIPIEYTLDVVNKQFTRDIVLGAVITLAILGFGYFSAIRVVTPIESLTADARAIAGGDIARRSTVDSDDEIGELARAFNRMADTAVESNAALKDSQEQLLHVQKMDALGSFAGGIAHDFNNYLAAIIAHAELADLTLDEDEAARLDLHEILAAASRAADLTRQILVFSRKQMVERKTLDLNQVVRGIELMLTRLIGESHRLDLQLSDTAILANADHGQLEQVVVNLVANARDAMPDGGTVTVRVTTEELSRGDPRVRGGNSGTFALLGVTDTGVGISDELVDRIFDPFFSTKERGRGTGMGLAIAYSIIEQTGGQLSVESTPGLGTTFTVALPLAASGTDVAHRATSNPPREHRPVSVGGGRILVAEDEPSVRSSCERILAHAGYEVRSAPDGASALDLLRAEPGSFDVLLSDVVMPGMMGSQVAYEAKRIQPDIGVLFMSGYADDALVHDDLAISAATCLAKPFSGRELCDAVERAISARRVTPSA